jgi:bleomycin hydrolase
VKLISAAVQMIKAGQPVFFGCDVGKFSDRNVGIMDTALFEYEVSPLIPFVRVLARL